MDVMYIGGYVLYLQCKRPGSYKVNDIPDIVTELHKNWGNVISYLADVRVKLEDRSKLAVASIERELERDSNACARLLMLSEFASDGKVFLNF